MQEGVVIRGLWYLQVEVIIYVKLCDADTDSYKYEPMATLLAWCETIKKDKHYKHCHYQWKHFPLFLISVDGMLGREYLVVLS